jgi:SAM-dependent methyltransferase
MGLLGRFHHEVVFGRRVRVLSREIAALVPPGRLVDVGSGSGVLAARVASLRGDVTVEGFDVLVRPSPAIPTAAFDGRALPLCDDSAAGILLVDVLHHADDPGRLLEECRRVAGVIVVKDHLYETRLDERILALMDWVGNRPHGVVLPYGFFTATSWTALCDRAGLVETSRSRARGLYPFPFSLLFGRGLHFVARLERRPSTARPALAT